MMNDIARAALFTLLIGIAVQSIPPVVAYVQTETVIGEAVLGGDDVSDFVAWGLQEGPTALIVMVILFFYRRDFLTLTNYWQEQNRLTTKLVEKSTAAQADASHALSENSIVMHGLKRAIEVRFDIKAEEAK